MNNQVEHQESTFDYLVAEGDIANRLNAIYALAFFLVALFFAVSPVQAVSYSVNGACYGDTVSVLEHFRSGFPYINDTSVVSLSTATISATGLVTYQTERKLHTSAVRTLSAVSTMQMPVCTSGLVANGDVQNMLAIILMVVSFFFGFVLGKNMFYQNFAGGQS
ncbi:MAG: hypothetical protein HOO97_10120 [Sideroxydans sp.]|nr:hypothetical protein [Sideroxydans sp.]